MEATTNELKYRCGDCVNKHTPICELCMRIDSPSGRERRPTYYVALTRLERLEGDAVAKEPVGVDVPAEVLERYLCVRAPLPMAVVLEYNRRSERTE